jgi:hypothetical protein
MALCETAKHQHGAAFFFFASVCCYILFFIWISHVFTRHTTHKTTKEESGYMRRQHVAAMLLSSTMMNSCPPVATQTLQPAVVLLSQQRTAANAWTNRSNLKTGDWVCTRCGFVSAASQHRCVDCKATRSENCFLINQMACLHCKSINHANNADCFSCRQPLSKNVMLAPHSASQGQGATGATTNIKLSGRLQRPEDVRVVKSWRCAYCATSNPLAKAICARCNKIKCAAR